MKSLLEIYKYHENKLGRSLDRTEIEFLNWTFKRYLEEQGVKESSIKNKMKMSC